jgi:hypothetical protein
MILLQPPLTSAWNAGLGPYSPVIQDGKVLPKANFMCLIPQFL